MDTPGIEPGAFRLQSERVTTALCAHHLRHQKRDNVGLLLSQIKQYNQGPKSNKQMDTPRPKSNKQMDTPGIEPGAFRLHIGRATTALFAQRLHSVGPCFSAAFLTFYACHTSMATTRDNVGLLLSQIKQYNQRPKSNKQMDTPGIEPGAFRLHIGRATTALFAQRLHSVGPCFSTAFLTFYAFHASMATVSILLQSAAIHYDALSP
ncbi:hypothetical protein PsorP6_012088 [Peronosclerospora sorghi]|uniref:Uncharacterized protein n=1 Tax=Peronosclerospora sorghi TaxID=230839 RepID=A0ACC0WK79_9STRA|nr:hypothetical protein PsorP6_012088 [Peronosclerospora sorghi]